MLGELTGSANRLENRTERDKLRVVLAEVEHVYMYTV